MKVYCFPQNKSSALQLSTQMWSGCRSSSQKPVSDQCYMTLPRLSQLICLHLCKYPDSQTEQLNFPVSYLGYLRGHTWAGHRGWFGSTCTMSVASGHTPPLLLPPLLFWSGDALGWAWALPATPWIPQLAPSASHFIHGVTHSWWLGFLSAEKTDNKMLFPLKGNIFKEFK